MCDVKHAPTYLAEMDKVWTGKHKNYDVADDYCTEYARSASMYTELPVVHAVQDVKAAAYQVKCKRAATDDIVEFEVPFYFLREAKQNKLRRRPDKNEIVLLQIDRRTLGQNFQIEQDLPELSPSDLKEHAKKVE